MIVFINCLIFGWILKLVTKILTQKRGSSGFEYGSSVCASGIQDKHSQIQIIITTIYFIQENSYYYFFLLIYTITDHSLCSHSKLSFKKESTKSQKVSVNQYLNDHSTLLMKITASCIWLCITKFMKPKPGFSIDFMGTS